MPAQTLVSFDIQKTRERQGNQGIGAHGGSITFTKTTTKTEKHLHSLHKMYGHQFCSLNPSKPIKKIDFLMKSIIYDYFVFFFFYFSSALNCYLRRSRGLSVKHCSDQGWTWFCLFCWKYAHLDHVSKDFSCWVGIFLARQAPPRQPDNLFIFHYQMLWK